MYNAPDSEEIKPGFLSRFKIRFPQIFLFKWYEITLHFIISLTYFYLTAFLIWRLKGKVPKPWYDLGEKWGQETRKPSPAASPPSATKVVTLS